MASLLLEIGTEELPPHFCREALAQWCGLIQASLEAWGFGKLSIQTFATPRRLAVVVQDLPLKQDDLTEDLKGPPAAHAFEGSAQNPVPTRAAVGFARRCGVPVEDLRSTPEKCPFVFARVLRRGRETEALLCEAVPTWIAALQGKRFMRWGTGTQRFSRPIRWLVALLDKRLLPIKLDNTCPLVEAQACSRGLRRGGQHHNLAIPTADTYERTLEEVGIILDRDERKDAINTLIHDKASELGATPGLTDDLLEELTDLVETPQLLVGTIDERFLSLPAEVTAMEMVAHQRYVPLLRVETPDPLALDAHGVLDPRFLMIANISPTADTEMIKQIIRGNERVLRARLADGEFFYRQDRSQPLQNYVARLDGVTFAEGLGSVGDRVERLRKHAAAIARQLPWLKNDQQLLDHLDRAAELCKADLGTQMVGEFPELQGVMGAKYALAAGEDPLVAVAIREHYLPRDAGDALPQSDLGRVLALAERLELLVSIFVTGHRPSGSSDPFALRRAGNGLMQILLDSGWRLNLAELLNDALERDVQLTERYDVDRLHGGDILPPNREPEQQLRTELLTFLHQRLRTQLAEQQLDHDVINAVASDTADAERLLADPVDVAVRAELLQAWRQGSDLAPVQAVVKRAARLVDKGEWPTGQHRPPAACVDPAGYVNPELFTSPVEQHLLNALNTLKDVVDDRRKGRDQARGYYRRLADGLSGMAPQLAAFFDGEQSVMVMVDDPAVRQNRLNLLAVLCNQARVIGDFSQLQGEVSKEMLNFLLQDYVDLLQFVPLPFEEELGNMFDHTNRLREQAKAIADQLPQQVMNADQRRLRDRTAELCKVSLLPKKVEEFPQLLHITVAQYVSDPNNNQRVDKVIRQVDQAIREHWLPRDAGDALPQSALGRVLALADRLVWLISIFLTGHRPSGSSDPFALRCAGNGLMQILLDSGWCLNLEKLLQDALPTNEEQDRLQTPFELTELYRQIGNPDQQLRTELLAFLHQCGSQ